MDKPLNSLRRSSAFSGANAEYIDQLYEAFLAIWRRVSLLPSRRVAPMFVPVSNA